MALWPGHLKYTYSAWEGKTPSQPAVPCKAQRYPYYSARRQRNGQKASKSPRASASNNCPWSLTQVFGWTARKKERLHFPNVRVHRPAGISDKMASLSFSFHDDCFSTDLNADTPLSSKGQTAMGHNAVDEKIRTIIVSSAINLELT